MTLNDGVDQVAGQSTSQGAPPIDSGIIDQLLSLWLELQELTHDRFKLAALETRRAGESLVSMIIAALMAALLLSGACLGLAAAAVLMLIENGVAASSALLLAVAFNLLLVLILLRVIRHNSVYLQFPSISRSLKPVPSTSRDAENS